MRWGAACSGKWASVKALGSQYVAWLTIVSKNGNLLSQSCQPTLELDFMSVVYLIFSTSKIKKSLIYKVSWLSYLKCLKRSYLPLAFTQVLGKFHGMSVLWPLGCNLACGQNPIIPWWLIKNKCWIWNQYRHMIKFQLTSNLSISSSFCHLKS